MRSTDNSDDESTDHISFNFQMFFYSLWLLLIFTGLIGNSSFKKTSKYLIDFILHSRKYHGSILNSQIKKNRICFSVLFDESCYKRYSICFNVYSVYFAHLLDRWLDAWQTYLQISTFYYICKNHFASKPIFELI